MTILGFLMVFMLSLYSLFIAYVCGYSFLILGRTLFRRLSNGEIKVSDDKSVDVIEVGKDGILVRTEY